MRGAEKQRDAIDQGAKNFANDMGTVGRFVAGMGQGASRLGRAIGQNFNLVSDAEIAEANRLDAPLTNTTAGKVGSFTGTVSALAPTMLIPGANTYAGATALGAGTGFVTTEGDFADRAKGAVFGAAGGAAGKALGDAVGAGVGKLMDRRATKAAELQAQNAARDATLSASREAGYVVPPSQVEGSSTIPRVLEGLGGKIKTEQAASVKNAAVTNSLARKAVGLPENTPITREALKGIREQAYQAGYEPIRNAGQVATDAAYENALNKLATQFAGPSKSFPAAAKNEVADTINALRVQGFDAGDGVDMIRLLREQADGSFRAGNNALAKAQKGVADALEGQLERGLSAAGSDGKAALEAFRGARQTIAKAHTVERALNDATGNVKANKLAQQLAKGKPLTDELRTAAEFGQAFPKAAQDLNGVAPYSVLDMFGAGVGGAINPAITAGVVARPAARSVILNPAVQRSMVNPNYSANRLLQLADPALNNVGSNALIRATPLAASIEANR